MDDLIRMDQAGSIVTFSDPTPAERNAIIAQYEALRKDKHALVISDEFHPHGEQKPFIRVFHYRSCIRCIENEVSRVKA